MEIDKFLTRKEALKILKIHYTTLYRYADRGIIEQIRTPSGHRLFNVDKYIRDHAKLEEERNKEEEKEKEKENNKKKICYCRVSTHGQKDDLKRQEDFMKEKYPNHEIISDIGSGINFKRKGIKKIIDYAIKGNLTELVIAYKDRLCRIGYELIEEILIKYSKTNIIIENDVQSSPEEEVVKDLIQIITVFGARVNGLRSYAKSLEKDQKICNDGDICV